MTERQSREVLNEAIRNRESIRTRLVNYAKGGKPYWVDIHLEPIIDSQGHLTGYISIEKDVTADEAHQHQLGELSASIYEELVRKVGNNGNTKIESLDKKSSSAKGHEGGPSVHLRRNRHSK